MIAGKTGKLFRERCYENATRLYATLVDQQPDAVLFAEPTDSLAMRFRIETSNAAGVPISEAHVGDEFLVNVYVQDTRGSDESARVTYSLDRDTITVESQSLLIGMFDSVGVDAYALMGSGARLIAIDSSTQPTSDAAAKLADGSRRIALASLTWQLQVDGSRGVSLAFEMAEESHEGRAAQPNEIRGAIPIPQNSSGLSAPPHKDSPVPETPAMPPNAKTVTYRPGREAENVRDEHRHYLAVSPLIVIAAGSLLVTEGWQKLQPREEKPKLR